MRKPNKDSRRKWLWWFLGGIAALQLYFVRELLAAFALFILGFAALAVCIVALYMVHKLWEAGVMRLIASQNSWILAARRGVATAEDRALRALRRAGSTPTEA